MQKSEYSYIDDVLNGRYSMANQQFDPDSCNKAQPASTYSVTAQLGQVVLFLPSSMDCCWSTENLIL